MDQPWKLTLLMLLFLATYQAWDIGQKFNVLGKLRMTAEPERISYSYVGDDSPNTLPIHVRKTAMNTEWLDDRVYGLYADDDWASNIPAESGYVDLGPDHTMYGVSMYHQLHCMDVMRHAFAAAKARALVWPGNGTRVEHHVVHCLNYIREMILCAADTTLEPIDDFIMIGGRKYPGATGINVLHRCRDWTQVRTFVEANREAREKRRGIKSHYDTRPT